MPTIATGDGTSPARRDSPYSGLPNKLARAANGIDYAYRDTGPRASGGVPLVLFQHFRGNLDNWDPALIDALASARRVITFDNTGVGGSTGTTPNTVEQMAHDAIAFIAAMDLGQVDLLGCAIGTPETSPEEYLDVFFARSSSSRQAGQEAMQRMYARTEGRDTATTWATREAQYDAVCTWGIPDHARLERLSCLKMPVFVANGDSDPMILPHYSYLLAGLIPQARVKIYPDSAHGFLFQHTDFAADVEAFLSDPC
jgi:pimeloyl-ACP methyl ester carboxylesterase